MSIAFELTKQQQGRGILAAARKQFRTAPGERGRSQRTHYDTFDWRLWRAGYSLAATRESKGWTLECRRPGAEPPRIQQATAEPGFAWQLPPGPLRDELAPILKMRRLLPLMQVQHTRRELRLLDRRDKTVAKLLYESNSVRPIERKSLIRLPARLVVKRVRGFDRAFDGLLAFLEGRGLARDDGAVLERAYRACGLVPGDYRSKVQVPLEPRMPAHLAMRRIHRQLLEVIRANEPGLRQDLDSEFLHDYRVAVRRTRAALGQVKKVFPTAPSRRFGDELRWLGGLTNVLRDLDVYLLKLDDYRASLPAEAAGNLKPLERLLRRRQRAEHRRVVKELDSERYRRLLSSWASFLADEETPDTPPEGKVAVAEVAHRRILKAHARVIKKGRRIGPDSPDDKLHRLRIDCKKLRYLLEFFRSLYPEREIGAVVGALKALQDNLGDFNDLSVQQGAMRGFADELAAAGEDVATLLALGQLITGLARRQGEERLRFRDQFGGFDRPKVRKRLVRMLEGALR